MSHKDPSNTEENGVSINNQKILRSPDGKFLKGTPPPNPSGRPKDSGFKARLNELVGDDSRELALKLTEICFYNQKECNDRFPRFKPADQLKALELILKYKEQLPIQKQETTIITEEDTKWKLEVTHVDKNKDKEDSK